MEVESSVGWLSCLGTRSLTSKAAGMEIFTLLALWYAEVNKPLTKLEVSVVGGVEEGFVVPWRRRKISVFAGLKQGKKQGRKLDT